MERLRAWTFLWLVWHEFGELVMSFRCRVLAVLTVGSLVVSGGLYGLRHLTELESYQEAQAQVATELAGKTVAQLADLAHPAHKPPWRLAFLADGGQARGPAVYYSTLSPLGDPQLGIERPSPTEWPHSEALDWLFVLRVVLPLVAFILGYDAFSSHRSRQRLRLTLAQPLARVQVLAAKGLALWILLTAFLLLGTILALPFLQWGGELRLTAQELAKIALALGFGCWAAALFSLLTLLVSTLSRTSTDSLAIAALLWVTMVVVIPAVAHLLAQMILPLPGEEEMAQRFREVQREFLTQEGASRSWRRPEMAVVDNFASERQAAAAETRRFERQEALRQDLIRRQFAQVALARRLSLASPMWLVQDVIERLLGAGSYRDQRFIEQAHVFRARLAAQVRALDQADPQSPHLLFFSDYLSKRPVLAADVPRFTLTEASLPEGLRLARERVVDLMVWTLVLLLINGVAFARLQVG